MANHPRFTAKNLPVEYRDTALWPQLDLSVPELSEQVPARQRAIAAYIAGQPLTLASAACGISKAELLRLFNRCLELHPDGRIYGWRALQPYLHVRGYKRTATLSKHRRGLAGAFSLFLAEHPDIKDDLDAHILKNRPKDALPESRLTHSAIYSHFERSCIRAGIARSDYPFSTKDQGRAAVSRYTRQALRSHFAAGTRQLGGQEATTRARTGNGHHRHRLGTAPFDVCSCDAHQLSCIGTVAIPTARGVQHIPIARMHFIPVLEEYSEALLGYSVAIRQQPSASDVVEAVKNSTSVWRPRELRLPGFSYPEGAMMPSAALPQLAGLSWAKLLLDNASIHYATSIAERVRRRVGCAVNYGPVAQWSRRPLIEAVFSALHRRGFSRLPSSTGSGPEDPLRVDAVTKAVEYQIVFEELLDLLDVLACTHNVTPKESLGNLSPLEVLSQSVLSAREWWLPRTLPTLPSYEPDMDVEVLILVVRGNLRKGRRPYVQYESVRYTNHVLANASGLIKTELRCHVTKDLTSMRAFFPSGQELGVLTATGGWARSPHDLKLRKQILAAIKRKELRVAPGEDPVQAFLVSKAQQAVETASGRGRVRVSKAATDVAHISNTSGLPIPEVTFKPVKATKPPAPTIVLPSFLPPIHHKGLVK